MSSAIRKQAGLLTQVRILVGAFFGYGLICGAQGKQMVRSENRTDKWVGGKAVSEAGIFLRVGGQVEGWWVGRWLNR